MAFTLCSRSRSIVSDHDRGYRCFRGYPGGTSTSSISATDMHPGDSAVGEWLAPYEVVPVHHSASGVVPDWRFYSVRLLTTGGDTPSLTYFKKEPLPP